MVGLNRKRNGFISILTQAPGRELLTLPERMFPRFISGVRNTVLSDQESGVSEVSGVSSQ